MNNKQLILAFLLGLSGCHSDSIDYTPITNQFEPEVTLDQLRSQYSPTMDYAGEAWFDQHEVFSINEMNHRANFNYYDNEASAFLALGTFFDDIDHTQQSCYQSLNGQWYLKYVSTPKERLRTLISANIDDYREDWDITSFDTVTLPMCLQTQKDKKGNFKYEPPIYMNNTYPWLNTETIQYGWDGNVVAASTFNSVSHFKRHFTVDNDVMDKTALLHVEGISSAYYVYINGQCIGYSEDSYMDSYFDITTYLKPGENSIAFEVYRYSDGSYLENQDMIRLSGIFRDVSIEYTDKSYIYDIVTTQNYENGVGLDVMLTTHSDKDIESPVTLTLQDGNGNVVAKESKTIALSKGESKHTFNLNDLDIKRWNSDDPNLYTLVVNLNDTSIAGLRVGFRELTWDDKFIYINGIKIELKGINRHEMDPLTGKVLTKDKIAKELTLIKNSNINAIRLSHYPNNNLTYDLADELGLLLIDEANIESHGGEVELHIPGNNPIFVAEMKDRFSGMVARDRNHASVIIYSYGNESTYSEYSMDENYGFYVLSQLALALDDSRLRMYERDNRYGNTREESMVDIASSQYYSIDQMKESANEYKIPYLQQEYAHAMGNALGNFKEYHDAVKDSECAGGFVWDFKDQSIVTTIDGKQVYGNGYDWKSPLTDGTFCGNGIVFANGKPQPELYDLKQAYQYVDISYDTNNLTITNNYPTINLNKFKFTIVLLDDGNIAYQKDMIIDCNANESVSVALDLPNTIGHRVLQVRMIDPTSATSDWQAYAQFELNEAKSTIKPIQGRNELSVKEDDNLIIVSNLENTNRVTINKHSGVIESIVVNDSQVATNANDLILYRAPLENDPPLNVNVLQPNYSGNVTVKSIKNKDGLVCVDLEKKLDDLDVSYTLTYTINSDAIIDVKTNIKLGKYVNNGPISAIGLQMFVPSDYLTMNYYGNGETDHYIDRHNSAAYGVYAQDIRDNTDYFLKPTTRNHKYDVSWLTLDNTDNQLCFTFDKPVSLTYANASNYQLATSNHDELIAVNDTNVLVIELEHLGVGNGSYGPSALEQYTIKDKQSYQLNYQINCMKKGQ